MLAAALVGTIRVGVNYGGRMLEDMAQLVALFAEHCVERSTLDELGRFIGDRRTWPRAHDLFDRIRKKTLEQERVQDPVLGVQYLFEETCAKTLFNLSGTNIPFDADSPYWIVPNAIYLARALGIAESRVLEVVVR